MPEVMRMTPRRGPSLPLLLSVLLCGTAPLAYANPVDGTVVAGTATIHESGPKLDVIQITDKAVIDWRGFDIEVNEHTQFTQPSAQSMTLNRVNSNDPSRIMGTLSANGNVVLVNPNGVFFGRDSRVDVNGLVATTADIANDKFMQGDLKFDRPGNPNAVIENQGRITAKDAGLVGLVAPNVINSGTITARLGRVQLASGDSVTLDMYGDGLLEVKASDALTSQLVEHSGTIRAEGGTIALTAAAGRQAVNAVVKVSGELQAPSIGTQHGKIVIAAEGSNAVIGNEALAKGQKSGASTVIISGKLDVANATGKGGHVEVTGDRITVTNTAQIDASGATGGGVIHIGGERQGLGETPAALELTVQEGAVLQANATVAGNGGEVIMYADDRTEFQGNAEANGAGEEGEGGFVETSGRVALLFGNGRVMATGRRRNGEWLLDPADVTIDAARASTIRSSLNAGTNVTVDTSGVGGNGDIFVNSAITTTGTGSLTLTAYRDINVSSAITLTSGALTLQANNSNTGAGRVNVGAALTTNGGAITIGGGSNIATGYAVGYSNATREGVRIAAAISSGAGSITIRGQGYGSGSDNYGVYINNVGVGSTSGAISVTGIGGGGAGADHNNHGVYVTGTNGAIASSGAGMVTVHGTGGTLTTGHDNYGVYVAGAGNIRVGSNAMTVTGIGGGASGAGYNNYGVYIADASSRITSSGSGQITVMGTGGNGSAGNNHGVYSNIASGIAITSGTNAGAITVKGIKGVGTSSYGVNLAVTNAIYSTVSNMVVSVFADTLSMSAPSSFYTATNGIKVIAPYSNIGVSVGNDVSGTLNISDTVLGALSASTWRLGATTNGDGTTNSYDTTIDTGFNFTASNIAFIGGQDVNLAGTLSKSTTVTSTITLQANRDVYNSNGAGFAAGTGRIHLVLNSDYDGDSSGRIQFTNSSIALNSGSLTMGGGANPAAGYAYGRAGAVEGIKLENVAITGNVATMLRGHGYNAGSNAYGISLIGSTNFNNSTAYTLDGAGGGDTGGSNNHGLFLQSSNSVITGSTGSSIMITGYQGLGSGSQGLYTDQATNAVFALNGSSGGNITINADRVSFNGAASTYISAFGTLSFIHLTGGMTYGIGTVTGGLDFSNSLLDKFSPGGYLFGSTTAGNITIDTTKRFSSASFISGNDIHIASDMQNGFVNSATWNFQANRNIYTSNNAGFIKTLGTLTLIMTADFDQATDPGGAIRLSGSNIQTRGGSVTLGGPGGLAQGNAQYAAGVTLDGVTMNLGTTGDLTIQGRGYHTSTNGNNGVLLNNTSVTARNIAITGTGMGTGNSGTSYGILFSGGSGLSASGTIALTGTGGGAGSGSNNAGIQINSGSTLQSTSGAITIDGTATAAGATGNHGVVLSGAAVQSTSGAISITAAAAGTNAALVTDGTGNKIGNNTSGAIELVADRMNLAGLAVGTTNSLSIRTKTANSMGLGAGGGTLSLDETELGYLSAGSYVFGSTSTVTDLTIATAKDFLSSHLTFLAGQDINLTGGLVQYGSADLVNYTFRANRHIANSNSMGISTTSGGINLLLDTDYDNNGTGTINWNGTDTIVRTGTGSITLNDATTLTGGRLTLNSDSGGVTLHGALTADVNGTRNVRLTAGTGTLTVNGLGTSSYQLNDLTIVAGDLVINGDIYGDAALVIQSGVNNRDMNIGVTGSGDFNITTTEWGRIKDGWNSITIGANANTGQMTLGTITISDPITFRNNNRISIGSNATLTTTQGATLTFTGAGNGWFYNINGGTVDSDGAISLMRTYNNGTITTTNDDITFNGVLYRGGTLNVGNGSIITNGISSDIANQDLNAVAATFTFNGNADNSGGQALRNVSLYSSGTITLPSITASNIFVRILGTGDIAIASGKTLTATGTGNALVLASSRHFINNSNSTALSAANGRWLVYSADPANNTRGGLMPDASDFNKTYGSNGPSSIGPGNRFVYSRATAPTVTLATDSDTVTYGDAYAAGDLSFSYVSGLVGGDSWGSIGLTGTAGLNTTYVAGTTGYSPSAYSGMITGTTGTLASKLGYQFTFTSGDLSVLKRALGVALTGSVTRDYDGTSNATLANGNYSLSNRIGSDDVSIATTTGSYDSKQVGTGKTVTATGLTLTGAAANNYSVASSVSGAVGTITKKTLTLTGLAGIDREYDGTTVAGLSGTAALNGAILGDALTLTGSGSGNFANKHVGSNKAITITGYNLTGSDAGNYDFVLPTNLTASVTPKALTLAGLAGVDREYDGTTVAGLSGTATFSGNVLGDNLLLTGTGAGSFATKNVGSNKTITVSGYGLSGSDAGNYTLSQPIGLTANVTPKALTLTGLAGIDREYDGTTVAGLSGTAALSGGVLGDSLSLTGTGAGSFANKNVGSNKAITVSGYSLSGGDAANYTLSQPAGLTANVTAKALTITGLAGVDREYDGTTVAGLSGSAVLNGGILGDALTLTGTGAGNFANKNVGSNKAIAVSGYGLSGGDAGNYTLSQPVGLTASVTPKALTITGLAGIDREYDGSTVAGLSGTAALSGGVLGDNLILGGTGAGNFANKNVGSNKAITLSGYNLTGSDAGNYSFALPISLTANVTAKALTITGLAGIDREYDGTTVAGLSGTAALSGGVLGDSLSLTGTGSGSFADKHAGSGKLITISGYGLAGGDAGNYTLSQPTGLTATIAPKALTLTGLSGIDREYDGTTIAGLAGTAAFSGNILGDNLLLTGTGAGSFANKNVGSNKAITVSGYGLSGSDAANYSFTMPTGLTASVTPKALTITGLAGIDREYDGSTVAGLSGTAALSGSILGDNLILGGTGAGSFANKNVGSNKAITLSGYNLTGSDAGNYSFALPTNLTANVTTKALTITGLAGIDREYDGTTVAGLGGTAALSGAVLGDALTLSGMGAGSFANKNAGNGKLIAISGYSLTGSDAGNYSFTMPTNLTANVTPKALTITGLAGIDREYDGTTIAGLGGTAAFSGNILGDALTLSGAGIGHFADKDVGNGKTITISGYTLTGGDAGNYSFSLPTNLTANVTPRQLYVTAASQNVVYGASIPGSALHYSGFAAGENSSVLDVAPTLVSLQSGLVDVGTYLGNYVITPGSDSNYTLHYTTGDLTITPRALQVITYAASKYENESDPAFNGEHDLLAADAALIGWTYGPIGYGGQAGSYVIGATASDPAGRLANYTRTNQYGTFTVRAVVTPPPMVDETWIPDTVYIKSQDPFRMLSESSDTIQLPAYQPSGQASFGPQSSLFQVAPSLQQWLDTPVEL